MGEISAIDTLSRVTGGDGVLIDVREQDEWDRGHSPLARSLPMSALEARIDELPKDSPLLVVCHSGIRSARVSEALVRAGFDSVSVTGGMIAMQQAGAEIVADGDRVPTVD